MPQEVGHFHPRDCDRALECHEDPSAGTLVGFHLSQVYSVEVDRPFGDEIVGMTSYRQPQCALARTVWSHEGVSFPKLDLQVHASKDRFVIDGNVEVLNTQYVSPSKNLLVVK